MKKVICMLCAAILMAFITVLTVVSKNNDTYLSADIIQYCKEIGSMYHICPELIEAIIETESSGKPDAVNGSCKGLMQINITYHTGRMENLGVTDLFDAYSNILVGTDYLLELFEKYEDSAAVLMVYHGEKNAVEKAWNGEISSYAQKILDRSAELEILHGK